MENLLLLYKVSNVILCGIERETQVCVPEVVQLFHVIVKLARAGMLQNVVDTGVFYLQPQ